MAIKNIDGRIVIWLIQFHSLSYIYNYLLWTLLSKNLLFSQISVFIPIPFNLDVFCFASTIPATAECVGGDGWLDVDICQLGGTVGWQPEWHHHRLQDPIQAARREGRREKRHNRRKPEGFRSDRSASAFFRNFLCESCIFRSGTCRHRSFYCVIAIDMLHSPTVFMEH